MAVHLYTWMGDSSDIHKNPCNLSTKILSADKHRKENEQNNSGAAIKKAA